MSPLAQTNQKSEIKNQKSDAFLLILGIRIKTRRRGVWHTPAMGQKLCKYLCYLPRSPGAWRDYR